MKIHSVEEKTVYVMTVESSGELRDVLIDYDTFLVLKALEQETAPAITTEVTEQPKPLSDDDFGIDLQAVSNSGVAAVLRGVDSVGITELPPDFVDRLRSIGYEEPVERGDDPGEVPADSDDDEGVAQL